MTPFVIVGMPRTGSQLLLTSMQQNPAVRAFGELFNPDEGQRSATHAIYQSHAAVYYSPAHGEPIDFLKCWVWNDDNRRYGAVGFKLFTEYVRHGATRNLLSRVRDETERLHFIHICRPNHFDVMISRMLARYTGEWTRPASEGSSYLSGSEGSFKVTPPPDFVAAVLTEMQKSENTIARVCSGRPYLPVYYDNLASDLQGELSRVFNFLSVPDYPVKPLVEKQIRKSTREIVPNYDELARHFAGTPFGAFFTT